MLTPRSRSRTTPVRSRTNTQPNTLEQLEERKLLVAYSFDYESSYPAFSTPETILSYVTGDIDADGDDDLVASTASNRIYTIRNYGDGTYGAPKAFRINGIATQLILADFDGDGDNDLAAIGEPTNNGSPSGKHLLRVFLSDRFGSWSRGKTIKVSPGTAHAGNFDTDSRMELAVLTQTQGLIYQMNVGIPNAPRALPSYQPGKSAVGHLNDDYITDIAIASNDNMAGAKVTVYAVTPGIIETSTPHTAANGSITSIAIGEVVTAGTGAGHRDIILAGNNLDGFGASNHGIWVLPQLPPVGTIPVFISAVMPVSVVDYSATPNDDIEITLRGTGHLDNVSGADILAEILINPENPGINLPTNRLYAYLQDDNGNFDRISAGSMFNSDELRSTATVSSPRGTSVLDLLYISEHDSTRFNKIRIARNNFDLA